VVEQSRDFDPAAFADFARKGNVREWLTPLAADARARALLPAGFVEELATLHATQPGLKQALVARPRHSPANHVWYRHLGSRSLLVY